MHLTAHGGLRQSAQMWLGEKKKESSLLHWRVKLASVTDTTLIQATSLPLCRCKTPLKQSVIVLDPLQHVLPQTLSSMFYPNSLCFVSKPMCTACSPLLRHGGWPCSPAAAGQRWRGCSGWPRAAGSGHSCPARPGWRPSAAAGVPPWCCRTWQRCAEGWSPSAMRKTKRCVCVCRNGLHQYLITTFC